MNEGKIRVNIENIIYFIDFKQNLKFKERDNEDFEGVENLSCTIFSFDDEKNKFGFSYDCIDNDDIFTNNKDKYVKSSVIKGDIDRLTTIKGSVIIEEGSIVLQEIMQLASWRLRDYHDSFLQLQFSDDIDDLSVRLVHRLRVICRRIRAGLKSFQLVIPEEDFKLMNNGFRDFARWFAEIRDIDVLLEELVSLTGQTGPFQQDDAVLKAIEKIRAKRRFLVLRAVPKVALFFDSEAYKLFSGFIQENQMVQPGLPVNTTRNNIPTTVFAGRL